MITIRKGQSQSFVVTLTEKETLVAPNYLFEFTSPQAPDVTVLYMNGDDASTAKERYNQFTIVTDTYFDLPGMYSYRVFEQEGDDLTTTTSGKNILETGIVKVNAATTEEATQYDGDTSPYKVYNG